MACLEAGSELQKKLRAIATTTVERTGTVLFRRGDQVKGTFLVLAGEVWMGLEEHDISYPSRLLGAGCAAGLPATLSGEPYSLTAKVAEDSRIAFIPRTAILNLLRHNPKLSLEIMRVLSEEISEMRTVFDEKRLAVRS